MRPDRRTPKPAEQTIDVRHIVDATGAREHRSFAGAVRRDRLSFAERPVVAALPAPYGDFRDWDAIGRVGGEYNHLAYRVAMA